MYSPVLVAMLGASLCAGIPFTDGAIEASAASIVQRDSGGNMNPTVVTNAAGNLILEFQDDTISLGTVKPSAIFNALYAQCDPLGCNANPFYIDTKIPNAPLGIKSTKIKVTVQQDHYATGIKNGMISALQVGSDAAAQIKKVNLHTCWPVGPQCETADDIPMTLYSLPASIAVYHGTDGLGSAATDWINVGLEIEDSPGEGGFCEYVTGVGSIVAGKIESEAAGGIFELMGLVCSIAESG